MNRKLIIASASIAALAFGVTSATADTTVIGSTGQSNTQGVNSSQSGENGSGGGGTYILGDSAPTTTQTSVNVLANDQAIGGSGDTTLIAPGAGQCFCQLSQQAVNSQQVAVNGDGGGTTTAILGDSAPTLVQTSVNVLANGQSIGADATTTTDVNPAATECTNAAGTVVSCDNTVTPPVNCENAADEVVNCFVTTTSDPSTIIIGGSSQVNQQGVNSSQSGSNGAAGGGGTLVIGGDALGFLEQDSVNILASAVVLGG